MAANGVDARDRHVPVLRDRCVALLAPALEAAGSVVVDATLGLAGHSEALLEHCPDAVLVGIDRDPEALALAAQRLAPFAGRTHFVHAVYDELPAVLHGLGLARVRGVLLDLGVSSMQLDQVGRGFSYSVDAPLDMRMDPSLGRTAADVLNSYPEQDLIRVLREYGEERFAPRIARAIVGERARAPFTTSARLVELVIANVPAATRRTGGNPAKRTFQALRIEVNRELDALRSVLPAAVEALEVGGRIVVLAYHSLEDRIVKQTFTAGARDATPPGLPVDLPEHAPVLRLLTRGAETAGEEETARNPRAASVRLRAAERIRAGGPRSTRGERSAGTARPPGRGRARRGTAA